jgi:hypothetical protein
VPGFGCNDDAQCRHGDVQGQCEPIGFCAYPDSDCPSGARYSQYAGPPYKNECTPDLPMGSTTAEASTESSGSTGDPEPVCGNGILEDGEECDEPGLPTATCNRCCRISGAWREEPIRPAADLGTNEGYDIVRLEDGDFVVVGRHAVEEFGFDALVLRFSPEGEVRWSRSFRGEPYVPDDPEEEPPAHDHRDEARSIGVSPSGDKLLVGGFLTPGSEGASRGVMWLTELDAATGDPLWEHLDGEPGPDEDHVQDATYDPAGGIIIAGHEGWSPRGFAVRRYAIENGPDGALSRTWAYVYYDEPEPPGEGQPPIVAGQSFGQTILVSDDLVFGAGTISVDGDSGRHLRPFDLFTGDEPRASCPDPGDASGDGIWDLAAALDDHIALAGFRGATAANRQAWVALYGPRGCDPRGQGNPIWRRFDPVGKEARGIVADSDGNLFVAGYADGNSGRDIWVAKYLHMDEKVWEATHDGPLSGHDEAWSLVLDDETCEVAVVGHLESLTGRNDTFVGWLSQ